MRISDWSSDVCSSDLCGRRLSRSRHDRTPSLTKQQQIDLGRARGLPKIRHVRAFTVRGGGADYHDQPGGHWIDDHIATPMARYPEYRASRQSFGINVLGTLVVEIEAEDGTVGLPVTTGGEPACLNRKTVR